MGNNEVWAQNYMLARHLQHLSVEEVANTITHGAGLILSIVGFVVLIALAGYRGDALSIIGLSVYGVSLIVLYAASTIYHSTTSPTMKRRMQLADHCGIYLLIAGSYTPFGLIVLKGPLGQNLLIALWAFAVLGIIAKLILRHRWPAVSVVSYLVMGWVGVLAIQPLLDALGMTAIVLVIAGGVAYSLGVVFFAWHRIRHHHAIFHVFVLAGSLLHYLAIVMYVVPRV
jgi:hemolysin III